MQTPAGNTDVALALTQQQIHSCLANLKEFLPSCHDQLLTGSEGLTIPPNLVGPVGCRSCYEC